MAFSPSRRTYANYHSKRQLYSHQGRQQNYNVSNLTAKSPSIRSPRLNEQSQYTKLRDTHDFQELKIKLETVLKHNSQLLNENATLSEMVNSQRIQFEARLNKDQNQILKARKQLEVVLQNMKQQQKLQQIEISRLLDEISRLHEEKYRMQVDKNNELKLLKETYEKDMTTQIRNIKKSNEDSKQIFQLQIRKLKESIELKNFDLESTKAQNKAENEKLKGEAQELKNQIKHLHHIHQIELKELNQNNKQNIVNKTKQLQRQNQLNIAKLQLKVRKLKQDVMHKNVQIEQAHRKGAQNEEQKLIEIEHLKDERQKLIDQINEIQVSTKQKFLKQKQRIIQLSQLEKKNIQNITEYEKQCLQGQINKLSIVCANKSEEIKRLYRNNYEIKERYETEKKELMNFIKNLKTKVKTLQEQNLEEIQLLKIKMAKLHEGDITSLEKYYESQIILLTEQNKALEEQNGANRQKIHRLLQDNDTFRKTFQIELTKYKAKVQDYKIKFAAANLEFREQITSLGTKMSLTSQTLLRQTEQKKKGAQFYETQKKKFYALIQNKDRELQTAYQTMNRLKQLHNSEMKEQQSEILILKEAIDEKIRQLNEVQRHFQNEYEQKSKKFIQSQEDPDDKLHRQNIELRSKLQEAEKLIYQKNKDIEFCQKQIKSLQQQVGLRAGFLQTMQLESSAAIEDQKSKMKILMSEAEVAMKEYYEAKIKSRQQDNESLREQLLQKQNDIRQLIVRYNQLENRLKQMLDAQTKLSDMEIKIMNLGMDENLVKNLGELFARHQKE